MNDLNINFKKNEKETSQKIQEPARVVSKNGILIFL